MIDDKSDFLSRAAEAFHSRIPAALELWYREQIDLDRSRYQREAKCATVTHFAHDMLNIEAAFVRPIFERMSRSGDDAQLCLLLVARYVFAREAISRKQWRRPDIGGSGDRELNDACLVHLLGINRTSVRATITKWQIGGCRRFSCR